MLLLTQLSYSRLSNLRIFVHSKDSLTINHNFLQASILDVHHPIDELNLQLIEIILLHQKDTLCLSLIKVKKSLLRIRSYCYLPSNRSNPLAIGQHNGQKALIKMETNGAPQKAMIYLCVPVEQDMGTTSATISTIIVLKRIAAQSGISKCITKGRDSRTIAFPTKRVTKNR